MSRLKVQQNKQPKSSVLLIVIILVVTIVFILTVGLKILLGVSSFIAGLSEKNEKATALKKENTIIGDIDIQGIPVATNSPSFFVSGSVVNFSDLEFYLNGEKVKEAALLSSDNFSEEITGLKKGENEVFILAKSRDSSDKKESKRYTVIYKADKPKLEISEPSDNLKTSKSEVTISGSTDKETFVKINDLPIVVDSQGNFRTTIKLKDGQNVIEVTARDIAGNIEEKTLSVTYQKDE